MHGEAPEMVGKNIANPLPMLGPAILLLRHLGETEAADRVTRALDRVLREGTTLPRDLGGKARTVELAAAIIAAM